MSDFKTSCPKCKVADKLFVTKVTMVQSGRTLEMCVPLQSAGFEFDPNDVTLKDHSTTDEEVTCMACNTIIPLTELTE